MKRNTILLFLTLATTSMIGAPGEVRSESCFGKYSCQVGAEAIIATHSIMHCSKWLQIKPSKLAEYDEVIALVRQARADYSKKLRGISERDCRKSARFRYTGIGKSNYVTFTPYAADVFGSEK